ncbi:MAG: hypothetical protein LC754_09625 [Acidobacteria bacterium]|nr:hypothetical protein [Acidobacteriota bacterium]
MTSRFTLTAKRIVFLLVLAMALDIPAHSQVMGRIGGRGQGRREGRIVLPTPPFNPDAGILSGPASRRRNQPKAAPPRAVNRRVHADNRNPRPGTPRRRRVRRGWHKHRGHH